MPTCALWLAGSTLSSRLYAAMARSKYLLLRYAAAICRLITFREGDLSRIAVYAAIASSHRWVLNSESAFASADCRSFGAVEPSALGGTISFWSTNVIGGA